MFQIGIFFLVTPRTDHKCVLLKNPEGDRPTVVVFGGRRFLNSSETAYDTVEFWDLEAHQVTEPTDPKFLSSDSTLGKSVPIVFINHEKL